MGSYRRNGCVSAAPCQTAPMSVIPALDARDLRKSYGPVRAVEAFDLTVPPGIVLGFLGPNGAGKTTVIRMLSTVLRPDHGWFAVGGVPCTEPVEVRRRIGVLPENAGYPPGQTGAEWLVYHAQLFGHRRDGARRIARRLLEEVGLEERADALISSYSRGMRQRLGVARALVNDPELVILDEPTLGLDPNGQRQLLDLVGRLARDRAATVVLSTHLLSEVEDTCDQVLILNRGRIVAHGTVAEVVRRAGAPRRALLQVPGEARSRVLDLLSGIGVRAEWVDGGQPGDTWLTLPAAGDGSAATPVLRHLLDAGVPVLGFSLEGGRLSDAFLAVTAEDR